MGSFFRRFAAVFLCFGLLLLPFGWGGRAGAQSLSPPLLRIELFKVEPVEGKPEFTLTLTIKNSGGTEAKDVRVTLDGGDRVFPVGAGSVRTITSIDDEDSATVKYLLASRGELVNHPIDIGFEYAAAGEDFESTERVFVSFNQEPALKVTGFSAEPGKNEGEFELDLVLENKGHSPAEAISVRFTGDQVFPLAGSNLALIPDLAKGSSFELEIMMRAGARSDTYSIPLEITYRSMTGAEHKTNETIVLSAGAIGIDEADEEKMGTPRVMLERHTLSTGQVLAGGTFTLTLFIKNNADRAVGNMKISLGNIQVEGAAGGAGGTVFSPLDGSSSSFFVNSIAANGRLVKTVTLFVDPNATAMTYTLPINIEYEDAQGNPFSVNEAVNIPVLQESGIQVLSVDIPLYAMAGQAVPVSMEFANTGKVALNNVLVAIEGDFPKENATYFIPRLDIGISDFFQGMIIPDVEGQLSGNLAVTFLDARNQEVRLDHPFTIEVQPMSDMPGDMPGVPLPGEEQPGGVP
ncbi:MAG: hypothetical protein KGZ32_02365, partial [Dethiobacter sp.]|nr:hypothetical protein [Dethiobacter sp.]